VCVHFFGVAVKDVYTNKYNIDSLRQSLSKALEKDISILDSLTNSVISHIDKTPSCNNNILLKKQ
jgi:hypothetical protein